VGEPFRSLKGNTMVAKKWFAGWMIIVIMVATVGVDGYAAARVVADVDILTDNSAKITLEWSDGSDNSELMITSWTFGASGLTLNYKADASVSGFNIRTVTHEVYEFPMKVFLQPSVGHTQVFTDLPSDAGGYLAILNLYSRGIISGYPDGSFQATNPVTRAEFSKMLMTTADYTTLDGGSVHFIDVAETHWAQGYIATLSDKGIFKGKGDGLFDPEGQIKVGEVLAVLTRTFDVYGGHDTYPFTLADHWSNTYYIQGVEEGIVLTSDSIYTNYDPEAPATRELCAVLLSRVLENLHDVVD